VGLVRSGLPLALINRLFRSGNGGKNPGCAPGCLSLSATTGHRPLSLDHLARPSARFCRFARPPQAWNPEPPAREPSELVTRSGSAFLEQDEARFGQHPLLPGGQAAAGLPSRQVADYLNDLDQVP